MFMTVDQINLAHGKAGRDALRAFITSSPRWDSMRKAFDYDLGRMTMAAYKHVAADLVRIGNMEMNLIDHKPLPKPLIEEALGNDELDKLDEMNKLDEQANEIDTPNFDPPKEAPRKPVKTPASAAGTLATAIEDILKGVQASVSPEMVRDIVKEEISSHNIVTINIQRDGKPIGKVEGAQHPAFKTLCQMVSQRRADGFPCPVWITGPAGSGKTTGAKMLAKALQVPFRHQGAMTQAYEVLGHVDGYGHYHTTAFVTAYRDGGVVCLDEVDNGDNSALLALKGAYSSNGSLMLPNGETIERHKDCYILALANTWGLGATSDYIGRCKIDAAFTDEHVKLSWDYDEVFEREISGNPDWARTVQHARQAAREKGLKVVISPRASIHGAVLLAAGMSEQQAKEHTYLATLTADQRKVIGE